MQAGLRKASGFCSFPVVLKLEKRHSFFRQGSMSLLPEPEAEKVEAPNPQAR